MPVRVSLVGAMGRMASGNDDKHIAREIGKRMNPVRNKRLRMAYKPDDDLYNTKYEVEHTADQGYTPNFPISLDRPKVACRVGDVKMPRLVVQQKYAISVPF